MAALLLAVSVSIDALGVGFSFGMRGIKIGWVSKLVIGAFSVLYALLAVTLGGLLVRVLPPFVARLAGAGILCLMGVYVIISRGLRPPRQERVEEQIQQLRRTVFEWGIQSLGLTICITREPRTGDIDHSGAIDVKEALLLGFALSVDTLGAGVGIALTGRTSLLFPVLVGLMQSLMLYAGGFCGSKLHNRISDKWIALLSGLMLIAVGILKFF